MLIGQPTRGGPLQEFGDVELEDAFDALNDETFGGALIDGADWERQHEELTGTGDVLHGDDDVGDEDEAERRRGHDDEADAADVAASVSQLILDDDDIESLIGRPIRFPSKSVRRSFRTVCSPSTSMMWRVS